jgi:hypothetical protein
MKYLLLIFSLATGLTSTPLRSDTNPAPPNREAIEWCDI